MAWHDRILASTAILFLACASYAPGVAGQESVPTAPGIESPELDRSLAGYVVFDRPVGGLIALSLETGEELVLRRPGASPGVVHSVSGPDEEGRVAFVENHMVAERHLLKTIRLDGTDERVLFERPGDALWAYNGDEIGDYLALAPRGGHVAYVEDIESVQMHAPGALLGRGRLAIWNVDTGERVPVDARALDGRLQWFPEGGQRLLYSDLLPRDQALELLRSQVGLGDDFGHEFAQWDRIPVVFVLDVSTGTARALHVGLQPAVSRDGRQVVLRDLADSWRLFDLEGQRATALLLPGLTEEGVLGFVGPDLPLYWAWPTEGVSVQWTTHNSPLVGKKPMRTLKVADLGDGRFRTVVPAIDPRRTVSFGPGLRALR